jgi:23S rRNA (uracil1939-C5)-methyltransferase
VAPGDAPSVRVDIARLDADGAGVGASDAGAPVRAPGLLPGEAADLRVDHRGLDGTLYGRPVELRAAAPDRVEVVCGHFLRCGGCDFLHLDPAAERAFKRRRVAEALGREVGAVLPSPRTLGYRAVAKLVFGPGHILGSYAPRSHDVVDMAGCRIHAPVIERVADAVRRSLEERGDRPWQGARYLVLRAALPREVVHLTLVTDRAAAPAKETVLETLAGHAEVAEIWLHVNAAEGDAIFDPAGETTCLHRGTAAVGRVGTAEQHLASGAFAQVNPFAAERLYARAAELAAPEGRRVLDLYAGSGGVALTLAAAGAEEVLGLEVSRPAVEAARKGATPFRGRVRFEVAPVEDVQSYLTVPESGVIAPGSGGGFDTWVVNPPRKGLAPEVIRALRLLRPERVVYVSCHPDRLAEDVEALRPVFELDAVTPVDMFPRTRHVETVARLVLTGA